MGALNIVRVLGEALIAGYQFDTNGQAMSILPLVDNSGSLNIGDGTTDLDFKVFLGSTGAYFLCDVSANSVNLVSDFKVTFADSNTFLIDASANRVTVAGEFQRYKQRYRTIIASGTTAITNTDFGKMIFSATNHKFLTLPDPTTVNGAVLDVTQVITRNTTLQCVNATAGKFAWNGDNAVNSIRINTVGDRVSMISNGVDWYVAYLGFNTSNVVPNVATSF